MIFSKKLSYLRLPKKSAEFFSAFFGLKAILFNSYFLSNVFWNSFFVDSNG